MRAFPLRFVAILLASFAMVPVHDAWAHGSASHERAEDLSQQVLPPIAPAAPTAPAGGAVPKRYYIANDDHTDYEWAGDDDAYTRAFLDMLDFYMAQAEATATRPPDQRGRFNCDGSVWVREYEKHRSTAAFQRLIGHIRNGDITMPLNTLVQLYGAMPAEAVLRSFYYAGRLERRENLRFPLVVPMEDQTLPGGVASLWAGAGASYAWKGICDCATQIDAGDRPRDIYRFEGPDGRSVLMKWNASRHGNQSIGGYAEARDPSGVVDFMHGDPGFLARWPYDVGAAFGYGWDDLQTETDAFVDAAQAMNDGTRRVIVSNEVDFFRDFEQQYGATVPSFGASFGNEWDLLTASLGEVTAAMKRGVEKLRTAEALASIATLHDPNFMDRFESARDSADMACGLYYEHCFGPGPGVSESTRNAWQRRIQASLTGYVDWLAAEALSWVAAHVGAPAGVERHLVFNPLALVRTDVADLDVQTPWPLHVVDLESGLEVPAQAVTVDGATRVRILASDVPSVGYRVYEVRPGAGAAFPPSATVTLPSVQTPLYGVTVGPRGELTSVIDRRDGDHEMVSPGAAWNDLGDGDGTVEVETAGPVSTTLRVVAGGSPAHETRVTLFAGVDRIDVEDRVTENFGGVVGPEWSFDLPGAAIRHEEVGMIARVARQRDGGDYADQNTRTDWLTLNHFVDLSRSGRGVTLSSGDSPFFRAGNSTPRTLDQNSTRIQTVIGMQVDGPGLGISNQGGDDRFLSRYAFRVHGAWDPAAAMRFALEHQNPLVAARVTGGPDAVLPERLHSLLTLSSGALLWAVKPAEEKGQGLIVRVWNVADSPASMTLAAPSYAMLDARSVTHIETDRGPMFHTELTLGDALAAHEMKTYRVVLASGAVVPPSTTAPSPTVSVFPNPAAARDARTIAFWVPSSSRVTLTVHDLHGSEVARIEPTVWPAGHSSVAWPAGRFRPGIYFVRIEAGGRFASRRVVLL